MLRLAAWRNWQTQETQNLPGVTPRVGSIPSAATSLLLFAIGPVAQNPFPTRWSADRGLRRPRPTSPPSVRSSAHPCTDEPPPRCSARSGLPSPPRALRRRERRRHHRRLLLQPVVPRERSRSRPLRTARHVPSGPRADAALRGRRPASARAAEAAPVRDARNRQRNGGADPRADADGSARRQSGAVPRRGRRPCAPPPPRRRGRAAPEQLADARTRLDARGASRWGAVRGPRARHQYCVHADGALAGATARGDHLHLRRVACEPRRPAGPTCVGAEYQPQRSGPSDLVEVKSLGRRLSRH